ncbi:Uncharacterized protein Rs2_30642 [Raphanus sativus]|nr:Uncharacterized protein Rs2_30642 [Raphanus sativus]
MMNTMPTVDFSSFLSWSNIRHPQLISGLFVAQRQLSSAASPSISSHSPLFNSPQTPKSKLSSSTIETDTKIISTAIKSLNHRESTVQVISSADMLSSSSVITGEPH